MSDSNEKNISDIITQLSDSSLADTVGLMMQNAVTIQQSSQTVSTASVSTSCAMILSQG